MTCFLNEKLNVMVVIWNSKLSETLLTINPLTHLIQATVLEKERKVETTLRFFGTIW